MHSKAGRELRNLTIDHCCGFRAKILGGNLISTIAPELGYPRLSFSHSRASRRELVVGAAE
jgi:hypothetical protein